MRRILSTTRHDTRKAAGRSRLPVGIRVVPLGKRDLLGVTVGRRVPSLVVLIAAALVTCRAPGGDRFYALFFDGTHVRADVFQGHGWWDDRAMLAGRPLFRAANPVRIVEDTSRHSSLHGPCVLLANGDLLPGEIKEYLPPSSDGRLPARLLVAPASPLIAADPRGLEVRADRVLRIVAETRELPPSQVGAVVTTGRAHFNASRLRFVKEGVKVLTEDKVLDLPFAEIADLHFLGIDVPRAVLDDGLYPPQGPDATVVRLEASQGAVLTYHRDMTLVAVSKAGQAAGQGSPPATYIHVQPAWSLTPVLVPIEAVWRQSYRAANEVPLSLLGATLLRQKTGLHRWPWRRNENVEGRPLASGQVRVDLGLGTHSACEIALDLPPGAVQFTSLVGIDSSMGPGACAQCRIYRDRVAGAPALTSGLLRGGAEPLALGPLRVAGSKRLVLVTDFADEGRPADAYPLDIGDHVNWLMPLVVIEEDAQQRRQALCRFVPGWDLLGPAAADSQRIRVGLFWDEAHDRWATIVHSIDAKPLALAGAIRVPPTGGAIELLVGEIQEARTPVIVLHADGQRLTPVERDAPGIASRQSPQGNAGPGRPSASGPSAKAPKPGGRPSAEEPPSFRRRVLRWDLQKLAGRRVNVELVVPFDTYRGGLLWLDCRMPPPSPGS
jgi:hypothetical protein